MSRYKIVPAVLLSLGLSGCVVAGPDIGAALVDPTITGSIEPAPADPDVKSDGRIVRNAVSSARLEGGNGRYAWSNPLTGSNGVISKLSEQRDGEEICRSFQTSRQRFDGIGLYEGRACTDASGEWVLIDFAKV
ncbi:RT0821/Lpp0805 family surface protein [Jiella marina]|uniref:RT0821/Lpp0805 family surface protein n=1 Tax=Jiella sp. LLJ827 TaxID=2917712 RepID=UPI002101AB31|nr:RT0821/Lpp0805 family surface protein [Jiella sp. LLJ827]MCQ0986578.1 hypothetical protein [Jiella sp. LLJ827]